MEPHDAHHRRQAVIDRLLFEALSPHGAARLPSHDALPDDLRQAVDVLLGRVHAENRRRVTYEELERALPPRDVTAEDLEALFWILSEHGIAVEDGEPG